VTADNLSLYLMLVADYRLNREIASSCAAFLGGLSVLIDQAWLRMFNDRELQQLISGSATGGIDMAEMRQHVKLEGGYHDQHPVLQMLWEVLDGFDNIQRASFLKFVTGCSRCVFGHPLCAAAEAGHECIGCLNLAPIKDLCLWMEVIASCRWHHCRDIEKLSSSSSSSNVCYNMQPQLALCHENNSHSDGSVTISCMGISWHNTTALIWALTRCWVQLHLGQGALIMAGGMPL
jgi:hypothetical protein